MSNRDALPTEKSITRDPFPASKKIYVEGKIHDIKVAMREVELSDSAFYLFMRHPDRRVRRDAYYGIVETYAGFRNTERFDWATTGAGLVDLYEQVLR